MLQVIIFTNDHKLNDWLAGQAEESIVDIRVTYAPAYMWNREEYGYGNLIFVVIYNEQDDS